MVTDAKMQMVFGTKEEMPNSKPVLEAQEETATQTPRSTFKSSADLSVETPRSAEDEESDSESVDGNDEFEHQYYAFLREMAGSMHEATGKDDESEWDSEDEAGEEEEDGSHKHSNGLSGPTTDTQESGTTTSASPAGGPPSAGGYLLSGAAKGGRGQKEDEDPCAGSNNSVRGNIEPQEKAKWAALGDVEVEGLRPGDADLSGSTKSGERGSSTARSGSGSEDSILPGGEPDASKPREGERCWVPSPSHDNRGPVEDDYDVVQAVADFASKQSVDPLLVKRDCLQQEIRTKEAQVRSLWGPANNPEIAEKTRAHYAKVRMEILDEAEELRRQLAALEAGVTDGKGRSGPGQVAAVAA